MIEVDLIPIGSLDRRNPTERNLDDLLERYSKREFQTFDTNAALLELLEIYLAVVRRRNKVQKGQIHVAAIENGYLHLITKKTQDELVRRLKIAISHITAKNNAEALSELESLNKCISVLANDDQKNISATKREPSIMNGIITNLYKKNKEVTSTEVIAALRDMKGGGVVLEIDDHYVEIDVTKPGSGIRTIKSYKLSAIPTLLSRIKNPKVHSG
jgi:hypothetical protein